MIRHGFFIPLLLAIGPMIFCIHCTSNPDIKLAQTKPNSPQEDSIAHSILKRAAQFLDSDGERTAHDYLHREERQQLQYGDIILRKGYGMVSDFIASYLNEKYPVTHCAFYFEQNNLPFVLHCISNDSVDGIFTEPLANYIKDSQEGSLVAIRVKTDSTGIQTYMDRAFELKNRQIPFDMSFDDSDSTKMYCVEMMRHAFYPVFKRDILHKKAHHLGIHVTHMDNFFNDSLFTVLFNHFDTK